MEKQRLLKRNGADLQRDTEWPRREKGERVALLTVITGTGNLLVISGSREPKTLTPVPALLHQLCPNASCFLCTDGLSLSTVTPLLGYQTKTRSLPPKFCFIKNSSLWTEYS